MTDREAVRILNRIRDSYLEDDTDAIEAIYHAIELLETWEETCDERVEHAVIETMAGDDW